MRLRQLRSQLKDAVRLPLLNLFGAFGRKRAESTPCTVKLIDTGDEAQDFWCYLNGIHNDHGRQYSIHFHPFQRGNLKNAKGVNFFAVWQVIGPKLMQLCLAQLPLALAFYRSGWLERTPLWTYGLAA
jgi:hypothetical protein